MGGAVVAAAPRWEGEAGLQPVFADETPGGVLEFLTDLDHGHARLDPPLHVLASLKLYIGGMFYVQFEGLVFVNKITLFW